MSVTDLIVTQTDPIVAVLLVGILWYLRRVRKDLQREMQRIRERTQRLEDFILGRDGGEE